MKLSKSKRSDIHVPRLLALWQRAAIWVGWLVFAAFCVADSDRGEFTLREFLAMATATVMTIWCCTHPLGREKILITDPSRMRGEFRSRTNWPLVLFGALLLLVGVAAVYKIGHDLWFGLTTVLGVFEDFLLFFLELIIERTSRGLKGDVTESKMYILIFLLPIGFLVVAYNIIPFLNRGTPFRVSDDGQLTVRVNGQWQPLRFSSFRKVMADGISIEFTDPVDVERALQLPQERVFSQALGTRVAAKVVADFFRIRLEKAGFKVSSPGNTGTEAWECVRNGSGS